MEILTTRAPTTDEIIDLTQTLEPKSALIIGRRVLTNIHLPESTRELNKIPQNELLMKAFRSTLVIRALTALKYFYNIERFQKIITIVLSILPKFVGMIFMILVIIFLFACIGNNMFPYLIQTGSGVTPDSNFTTLFRSLVTLFRVSFSDGWISILNDMTSGPQPNRICTAFETTYENFQTKGLSQCGTEHSSFFFLYAFYTIVNFIMFNILIALVLESFETNHREESTIVKRMHVEQYQEAWADFDTDAHGMVRSSKIVQFLYKVEYPLCPPKAFKNSKKLHALFSKIGVPLYVLSESRLLDSLSGPKTNTPGDAKADEGKTASAPKLGVRLNQVVPAALLSLDPTSKRLRSLSKLITLCQEDKLYCHFHDVLLGLAHNSLLSYSSREYRE